MKKFAVLFAFIIISVAIFTASESSKSSYWVTTQFVTVNNLDGVSVLVQSVSTSGITLKFVNNSKRKCMFGEYFQLEKKISGRWYRVPMATYGNYGFDLVGYPLPSGEEREWSVDWKGLYGYLKAGEYRIMKDLLDYRGPGDFDTYYVAAGFAITAN